MYKHFFKPLMDFFISLLIILITSPIIIITIILLMVFQKGKVFFIQPRPGKDEKVFKLIKFKTMNDKRDSRGELLPDRERLTPIGNLVRKTSVDELPQLFNVIKGDMSLVGPRPLLVEYLPLYGEAQSRRHEVRPGITGWAQVNGRNTLDWNDKFNYDVWYVDNLSFWLDLKIILITIWKILTMEGIRGEGSATMKKFTGNT